MEWIDAATAAERLGVKPATLYAYVSRGCCGGGTARTGGAASSRPRRSSASPAGAGPAASRRSW
ncbi:hypothetical protein ACFQQB_04380 [Nonomuraea rubra]|uniref:hypothetical protein n=1 Tax=Nonomuraea rubra TaxID=46180 RepID=UPI00361E6E46